MSPPLHVLEREQLIARPRPEVFAFFADPRNLETMTPETLGFHILTPGPIAMRKGAIIDYDLRLFGVRFSWKTLIEAYELDQRFVDVQMKGPYKVWRHTHTFSDAEGGTLVRDRVEYALPFGVLGTAVRALFVRRTLEGIFDFRAATMSRVFADA
jgi:ligand-binding SRPBCC domain-containing protein